MTIKEMVPWRWGGLRHATEEHAPMQGFRREIETLHREMDRLFEDLFRERSHFPFLPESWTAAQEWPNVDQTEDEKGYRITVELPGMDEKDVAVTLADGVLTIRGEKKQEEEDKQRDYYRKERAYGSFRRVLAVPAGVDEAQIQASFKRGVLTVDLPKSEEARKHVKNIDIKAA